MNNSRNLTQFLSTSLLVIITVLWALTFTSVGAQDNTAEPDVTQTPEAEATATPIPRPLPFAVIVENGITVEFFFETIAQGQIGLVHVHGEGIAGARARFINNLVDFFPIDGDGFFALLSVGMEQAPRTYNLSIFAWDANDTRVSVNTQVEIVRGQFIRQDFDVPADRAYLIDPQVERSEFARLESIHGLYTPDLLWGETGFQFPLASEFTSPFGAFRTLNQTVQTRHTGWDLRAPVGTPIMAAGTGKVVFAGQMDIRGNHVIVDHGQGVFSGYSHLSQIHVTRGQNVVKGQIIGVTGDTGRSLGPHLHWEITVNGEWVDTLQFIETWLPTTSFVPSSGQLAGQPGTQPES